jgi:uncharacterized membrane protein YphA (DoxX/SURF4 family)
MAMDITSKINSGWWALRVALGLGVFLAGLDKFFNILTNWSMYLSPIAERWLPVSGHAFMLVVGVVEMLVGLAILTHWTRVAAYMAVIWLAAIAVNLVTTGMFFDLAVRDMEMAVAAYALARLTEVRAISQRSDTLHGAVDHAASAGRAA